MAYQKGESGNPQGRKRGSRNKVTKTLKDYITKLIDDNREQIEKDLKELTPKERLQVIVGLLPYVVPKMHSVEEVLNVENDREKEKVWEEHLRIEQMSDDEIKRELEEIRRKASYCE